MERNSRVFRIAAFWTVITLLVVTAVAALSAGKGGPKLSSTPRSLGEIELLATATSFDEFDYSGEDNALRGNFIGSLFSTDPACQASRTINFFKVGAGSVPDVLVATSISDNTGSTGNFTSTEYHDPPGLSDSYYAVVEPDETKGCEGATSDTIEVN